jgi:hypothetical protein
LEARLNLHGKAEWPARDRAKLERNLAVDREDVKYLARTVPLRPDVLKRRYQQELRPYLPNATRHDLTLRLWLEAAFPVRG